MYSKLISPFKGFDYLTGLLTENLDQKIAKLLQNQKIKEFVDNQKRGDADSTDDTQYLKRVANMFDPTPDKKFLEYVLKNWMNGNLNGFEDAAIVRDALKKYVSFTARNAPGLEKDINKYADIGDLYKVLAALQPVKREDVYKERIQQFLKTAADSYQKVQKIYDLPNGYHLYRVDSPPKKEDEFFGKSEYCQGYWCIKRPSMAHYYPLYFLEKNGFIELAVVPKAGEIKNPYNQTQYTAEQTAAVNFLFDHWEEINNKSGGKFFNPNEIETNDFGYFSFAKALKEKNLDFTPDQIRIEIEEGKEKYNQFGKVYCPPSLKRIKDELEKKTYQYVAARYLKDKINETVDAIKTSYNNLSLSDKLKYHWFYLNVTASSVFAVNQLSMEFELFKPFLPPSASTSVKALTELYRQHIDTILKAYTYKNVYLTPAEVKDEKDLLGCYALVYMYLILSNAYYFSTGIKDSKFVFEYKTNEEYKKEINIITASQEYVPQHVLEGFFGVDTTKYLNQGLQRNYTLHESLAHAFNNLDEYTESIDYTGGYEEKLKTIELAEPNKELLNSKSEEARSLYNIPELSLFLGSSLMAAQTKGRYIKTAESKLRDNREYYERNPQAYQGLKDNTDKALNSVLAFKKIVTGEEGAGYPKISKPINQGGMKDLIKSYESQNPIDVNNLLAINYLINLPTSVGNATVKSYPNTVEGLNTSIEKEVTGDILPNIGDLVYSKLYSDLDAIEKNENTKNSIQYANAYSAEKLLINRNISGQVKKFFDATDPSSLVIGNITSFFYDSQDFQKHDRDEIPFSTFDNPTNKTEAAKGFKEHPNTTLLNSTLIIFKNLEEKYGERFYPKNKSALSRTIYFMMLLHTDSGLMDVAIFDPKYCCNHLFEAMLNLSPEELLTLDKMSNFTIRFGLNRYIRAALKNNEDLQQKLYAKFKENTQSFALKQFYTGGSKPIKAPDNIEQELKLMKVKKYADAFAPKTKKADTQPTYTQLDPEAKPYIVKIGKYTLGKNFQVGYLVNEPYFKIGSNVLSGPTFANTEQLQSLIYGLDWDRIFVFYNQYSQKKSYIITGTFFNKETKETEQIVYYRKETVPGAGNTNLYMKNKYLPVTNVISMMKMWNEALKNGEELPERYDGSPVISSFTPRV